jgi:hypothetical protein
MAWKLSVCAAAALLLVSLGAEAEQGVDAYKVDATFLKGKHSLHLVGPASNPGAAARRAGVSAALAQGLKAAQFGSGIPGIDGVVNFTGSFAAFGFPARGFGNPNNTWHYAYVGNAPSKGAADASRIEAPIIPVTLELLDEHGAVALTVSPQGHMPDVLASPIFSDYQFTSSTTPTQFTDAIHRATFNNDIDDGWHTLLAPEAITPAPGQFIMRLPFGSYFYARNADGSCCRFVLVDADTFGALLFPPTYPVDNTTIMGQAELAGIATTKSITTLLFPDTYLFLDGNPNNCCVLGFHTFDVEPGTAANGNLPRFYTTIYASWVSPDLFDDEAQCDSSLGTNCFRDVIAMSHEMAETFADPFVVFDGVHNLTPWWLSGGNCQDDLEVGDVIEGLPSHVSFPMTGTNGFSYHPQNEALLQWFEFQQPSTALGGVYSYPDPASLPALSPRIKPVIQKNTLVRCNALGD